MAVTLKNISKCYESVVTLIVTEPPYKTSVRYYL